MTYKILVVDDERLAREKIRRYLAEVPDSFEVEEARNGLTALEMVSSFGPDLVFLDIEMPGLSGFEMLAQLPNVDFQVIFATAYDEYAVRAFEENACDYLLKPFTRERFRKALERARARASAPKVADLVRAHGASLDRVTVRKAGELVIVDIRDIICFQSLDHYTCVRTLEAEYLTELSLHHLEQRLDPALFLRVHRKSIVRLNAVKGVVLGPRMQLKLAGGLEVPVSRHRREDVQRALPNPLVAPRRSAER